MARAAAIVGLMWCAAGVASAQPLVPPGHEDEVMALFAPYELGEEVTDGYALWGARIERDRIEVTVRGPSGVEPSFVLLHRVVHVGHERTASFAVARDAQAREGAAAAVAEALIAAVRANDDGRFWSAVQKTPLVPRVGGEASRGRSGPLAWRIGSYLLLAIAVGWALGRAIGLARAGGARRLLVEHRWALALVVAAGAVALTVPQPLPVHEHNSFLARLDCARDVGCDRDPAGPAWLPTTFHVYGLALRAVPYRLRALGLLSLGFSLLSLLLLYAVVVRAYGLFDRREEGIRVALFAIGFLALQPAWYRIAVSGAFWAYSMCCVLAAGIALLAFRDGRRVWAALAAASFLALGVLGNMVFLALVPLAVIVPLAWRARAEGRRIDWRSAAALALFVLAVAPQTMLAAQDAIGGGALLSGGGVSGLVSRIAGELRVYFFDPRLSPIVLGVYLVLGVAPLVRAPRLLVPFAYVLVALVPILSIWAGHPLGASYPVGFLHAFSLLYPMSFFAAAGASWLVGRVPAARRGLATVVIVALPVLALPFASEGLAFVRGERVLERELVALSDAFESLPEHDLLVEGPHILPPLGGVRPTGDPIEVRFPYGEYSYVLARRGLVPAPLARTDWLLAEGAPGEDARILFYVGSKLRSFQPSEIEAGLVPDTLERPELAAVRERFRLVPVREFEIATAQHPAISVRLGADRVPRVTLGFYWLEPR